MALDKKLLRENELEVFLVMPCTGFDHARVLLRYCQDHRPLHDCKAGLGWCVRLPARLRGMFRPGFLEVELERLGLRLKTAGTHVADLWMCLGQFLDEGAQQAAPGALRAVRHFDEEIDEAEYSIQRIFFLPER